MQKSDLLSRLETYDGRAVSILSEAQMANRNAPGFPGELVRLCREPHGHIADGASWILKAELETGTRLSDRDTRDLLAGLGAAPSWQTQLHLCQSVEHLDLSPAQARCVFDWARGLQRHQRPFLRAWGLNACVMMGLRFAELHEAALTALCDGETDTAASVKARARALRQRVDQSAR